MINVTLQQTRTCDALRFQNRVRSTIDASAVYRLKKCLCINDVSFLQRKTTDLSKCVELLTLPCVIGTTIDYAGARVCMHAHPRASRGLGLDAQDTLATAAAVPRAAALSHGPSQSIST